MREKIVAANSTQFFIIVDESKLVSQLGKFPLPVEIAVFGWEKTMNRLSWLGCLPARRIKEGKPFLTDNGNYIIDCEFGKIVDSAAIHEKVNAITGVVDNGLFIAMASKIIVGAADGQVKVLE